MNIRPLKKWAAITLGASLLFGAPVHADAGTYVVKKGDTYWKISRKLGVDLQALMDLNPDKHYLNLYEGLVLKLPPAKPAATAKRAEEAKTAAASAATVRTPEGEKTYVRKLTATASAYTAAADENGGWAGLDYMGNRLAFGTIAVDPKVIPLGSTVYVTGYSHPGLPAGGFIGRATDTGGAIKGNRIDIFVPQSKEQAMKFGLQTVTVYVLSTP